MSEVIRNDIFHFASKKECAHGVLSVMQTKTNEPFILFAQFTGSC